MSAPTTGGGGWTKNKAALTVIGVTIGAMVLIFMFWRGDDESLRQVESGARAREAARNTAEIAHQTAVLPSFAGVQQPVERKPRDMVAGEKIASFRLEKPGDSGTLTVNPSGWTDWVFVGGGCTADYWNRDTTDKVVAGATSSSESFSTDPSEVGSYWKFQSPPTTVKVETKARARQ